jgi:hypothetical protein
VITITNDSNNSENSSSFDSNNNTGYWVDVQDNNYLISNWTKVYQGGTFEIN